MGGKVGRAQGDGMEGRQEGGRRAKGGRSGAWGKARPRGRKAGRARGGKLRLKVGSCPIQEARWLSGEHSLWRHSSRRPVRLRHSLSARGGCRALVPPTTKRVGGLRVGARAVLGFTKVFIAPCSWLLSGMRLAWTAQAWGLDRWRQVASAIGCTSERFGWGRRAVGVRDLLFPTARTARRAVPTWRPHGCSSR